MFAKPPIPAWDGRSAWCVLDTALGDGRQFLGLWDAWVADPDRPRMLHYVGIAGHFVAPDSSLPRALQWRAACRDLSPGFHRIALEGGRVSVTLCLGDLAAMLAAQDCQADAIWLPNGAPQWDKWAVKAVARCCRRGTQLRFGQPQETLLPAWRDAGFRFPGVHGEATYDPDWTLRRTRQPDQHQANPTPGHCAVVGAGLAGASVARALALRGWSVTVLDPCAEPAGGASGLPVGLVVPHVSADDNPRSRLSRCGARLTLAHARDLLIEGQDWSLSGVTEMRLQENTNTRVPLWHPMAGWIKTAALVRAWLNTPGVVFKGSTMVSSLALENAQWQLLDAAGDTVATADIVVLANACGCKNLLHSAQINALHSMFGTVSFGTNGTDSDGLERLFPPTPVNGLGSFVPLVPSDQGHFWAAGATFEPDPATTRDMSAQHKMNQKRLHALLPEVAAALAPQFAAHQVRAWSGERCVTHDRLPLVGPAPAAEMRGLWLSAGMGSRGLSFSALCAEVLAARLGGEPLPVEVSLLRSLDANRPLRHKDSASAAKPFVATPESAVD
jgi:tRNA 5-methylaminomethyl-2-thiouridine biosynthesis bifunctional protein